MPRFDIPWEDHYVGVWAGQPSRELQIRKIKHQRYLATLLINRQPIERPWMDNELTIDMPARYSFSVMDGSDFSIDLWTDYRFAIALDYEPDYQIYSDPPREALTMAIRRHAELEFLDQYCDLLGGLKHFVRVNRGEAERTNRWRLA